jgi:hypothetical protein
MDVLMNFPSFCALIALFYPGGSQTMLTRIKVFLFAYPSLLFGYLACLQHAMIA